MTTKENTNIAEIEQLKQERNPTKRASSPELEAILYDPIKLLDYGFIRVIDYMGNDSAITQAARVSYGKGTKTLQNDKTLIRYLMKHSHTSPFEMCEIKFHIKAPIFVARQWVRHRTANINEYSGRYSLMASEYYVPEAEQVTVQSANNKQGRGELLAEKPNQQAREIIENTSSQSFSKYNELLVLENVNQKESEDKPGVARELARIVLPLNTYTEFYWKIDLHNLLHFLNLRAHPHAQYEIRVYAEAMLDIVQKWVPCVFQAFIDYKKDALTLSKVAKKIIADILCGKKINKEDYSLSTREWNELKEEFNIQV